MKFFIAFFVLFYLTANQPQKEQYFVEFKAYNENMDIGEVGHFFVEFKRIQNDLELSEGTFGFWPKNGYGKNDFLTRETVAGKIHDDSDSKVDLVYRKEVTREQFVSAVTVKNDWSFSSRPYTALDRDCVTFGYEVAKAIGLSVPDREWPIGFPLQELKNLKELNQ